MSSPGPTYVCARYDELSSQWSRHDPSINLFNAFEHLRLGEILINSPAAGFPKPSGQSRVIEYTI